MSKEQDPLDPESDIFWEGPEAIRQNLQKSSVSTEPDKPYSLKPQAAGPGPSISRDVINTNTTLKRPAGPFAPNHKEPTELTEPEVKRLKETAKTFGYGREETLDRGNLVRINKATEGFRKLYVGALTANTTERDLEQYFSSFGNVDFVQVIRSKDTGQTKGFGFVTMVDSGTVEKILSQAVHVVDCRSIRVSLTHTVKNQDWEPPRNFEKNYAKKESDRIELLNEVNKIDVREGRLYVGALPFNVSPNILADHFSSYGVVAHADVSRAEQNICKKSFGVVQFKETMAVKRALQNPRHYINEQFVEIALSKFAIEAFLSPSTLWVWDLAWTITKEDLIQYFSKFGKVYRAMHIYNPITGDKKGYGFVDFIDQANMSKACGGPNRIKNFDIKGQRGSFAKYLDRQLKRDLMFMEDKFGNILLRVLNQRIPDSGEWGGGHEFNEMMKKNGAKTVTCKLPKSMLPVVVGEDGKIVSEIAKDSETKITLLASTPQEETVLFHIVGTPEHCKTAQYVMQIKIKERMTTHPSKLRYNR